MENLISGIKGVFAEKELRLGEGTDTKYYNYADMISICEVFLNIRNSTYIADMFMSDLIGATTIFGNGLSRGRVCIKVCNINFQETGTDFIY